MTSRTMPWDESADELLTQPREHRRAQVEPGVWFERRATSDSASFRLFCFPNAGGGSSAFQSWEHELPATVEVWAVQLPGRGARAAEPVHRRLGPLVAALHEAIEPHLDVPFAFFGHSMGALVAFELTRQLRRAGAAQPAGLFLAAFRAPQLPNPYIKIYHLPDEVLKTVLLNEGTPDLVLRNDTVMSALLPTIRADFEVCDTFEYVQEPPLSMPISVFGGEEDLLVGRDALEPWNVQTAAKFELTMLPGTHFFVHSARDLLLAEISRNLETAIFEQGT
jgi:surfactin synthase thioesterase subunit